MCLCFLQALRLFTLACMSATELQARCSRHVPFDTGSMFDRGTFINWRLRAQHLLRWVGRNDDTTRGCVLGCVLDRGT